MRGSENTNPSEPPDAVERLPWSDQLMPVQLGPTYQRPQHPSDGSEWYFVSRANQRKIRTFVEVLALVVTGIKSAPDTSEFLLNLNDSYPDRQKRQN